MGRIKGINNSRAGFSRLLPWIRGETPEARHKRRTDLALSMVDTIRAWCEYRGVEFRVEPLGFRMKFRRESSRSYAIWGFNRGWLTYKPDWLAKGGGGRIKINCPEQLLSALSRLWLRE